MTIKTMSKELVVLDCEVYPNYFLVAFKNLKSNKVLTVEIKGETSSLDDDSRKRLTAVMSKYHTFGFNSLNYDMPIIFYALHGATCSQLCGMSNGIIKNNGKMWRTVQNYNLPMNSCFEHFDIMEPTPGVMLSLKLYGGRLHCKKLQDLPIKPNTFLSEKEMKEVKEYCINDLDTTILLYNKIKERIELRKDMSKGYGQDFMSKSDAQIAEMIIKSEIKRANPEVILRAPKTNDRVILKYNTPEHISFESEPLKEALKVIENAKITLNAAGSPVLPKSLKDLKAKIGNTEYQLGIGGIHSCEKALTIESDESYYIIDKDVTSYYPNIILNLRLFPPHLGDMFLYIYKRLVNMRLRAKKEGNKTVNETLKIVLNGSFGKFGSKYSCLYSPELMLQVTLTGQLSLLMLIEQCETNGISVVSANTDGFVSIVPKTLYEKYCEVCSEWEKKTGFNLETNEYKGLYARDVNNYLAVKKDGSIKSKGIFQHDTVEKNPSANICVKAVENFITKSIPIERTIRDCKDIREFVSVKTVSGGCKWRGQYLGRVARWIYSTDGDQITYVKAIKSGAFPKVAKSDGARPMMSLEDDIPEDLDYDWYIKEAYSILDDVGYFNDL